MINKIEIVQGEGRVLQLGIIEDNGSPVDLTNADSIKIWLKKTDSSYLELSYADDDGDTINISGSPTRGEIDAELTAAESVDLYVCENADFQGEYTIDGAEPRKVIWEGLLTVKARKGYTPTV